MYSAETDADRVARLMLDQVRFAGLPRPLPTLLIGLSYQKAGGGALLRMLLLGLLAGVLLMNLELVLFVLFSLFVLLLLAGRLLGPYLNLRVGLAWSDLLSAVTLRGYFRLALHQLVPATWTFDSEVRSAAQSREAYLSAYGVRIGQDQVCFTLDGVPVTEIEWLEVKPAGEFGATVRIPLTHNIPDIRELQKEGFEISVESKRVPQLLLSDISGYGSGRGLVLETYSGESLEIPHLFPLREIDRELRRRCHNLERR